MPSQALLEIAYRLHVEEQMYLVRVLEDRLQELCNQGLAGDLHFNKGQESISIGVCSALRKTDHLVVHHRTIAHAVAKGIPLKPLVAELLGKATGINGGAAGEMHMSHLDSRFMFSFQLVGTCIPVSAGLAWAVKNVKKTDDIVAVFFGDAATANGQWHEGMNLAGIHQVPLLLVCENNRLAGNVPFRTYSPVDYARYRASGYGIQSRYVDASDVAAVAEAAKEAVAYVRSNGRPLLLECETVRLGKHKQGMGDARTKEEMVKLAERDPLRLISIPEERKRDIEAEVDVAIAEAMAAPIPEFRKESA